MKVNILIRGEAADSGTWIWWAESPQVPGFSAADPDIDQLRHRSEAAIAEILPERDLDFLYEEAEISGS